MKGSVSVRFAAHRGVHDELSGVRENTLAAVNKAIAAGADLVEIDVRLTADGETVVLHDPDMRRVWGDSRRIDGVTLGELREHAGEEGIPTLAEVLQAVRGSSSRLLIDMDDERFAAPAFAVVQALHMLDVVEWCGDLAGMRVVRAKDAHAVIWMPWKSPEPPKRSDLDGLNPQVLNMPHLLAGPAVVNGTHALGLRVACWTVDNGVQACHLARIGVDSITTNRLSAIAHSVRSCDLADRETQSEHDSRARVIAENIAADVVDFIRQSGTRYRTHVHGKSTPSDLVTDLDTLIEVWVRNALGAQFPEIPVVGEEMGGDEPKAGDCWFLDPLDGSINYANGLPWFSFSLALVRDGSEPIVGVVIDPADWRVIVAERDKGAWIGDDHIVIPERAANASDDPLQGAIVSVELANHVAWRGLGGIFKRLSTRYCTLRVPGSGTASVMGIALGRGVGTLIGAFGPVDHFAAVLIVREAGGVVMDEFGRETLNLRGKGFLAARDRRCADALAAVWRDSLRALAASGE